MKILQTMASAATHNSQLEKEDKLLGGLKAILYLLQNQLDEYQEDVNKSYELLKIGKKTPLTKKLEDFLDKPVDSLLEISDDIDSKVRELIDKIIKMYFIKNRHLIKEVYKTKTERNVLHYSIVLKKDDIENRTIFFEFLDSLSSFDKYPVYFQFIPSELIDKINTTEKISLSK